MEREPLLPYIDPSDLDAVDSRILYYAARSVLDQAGLSHVEVPYLSIYEPPWVNETMLRESMRPMAPRNDERLCELLSAAEEGNVDRLKVLLAQSPGEVNISMRYERRPDWAATPLHAAVLGGHLDMVVFLVALGADMEAAFDGEYNMFTPLHNAVKQGDPAMTRLLLDLGADVRTHFRQSVTGERGPVALLALGEIGCPLEVAEGQIETLEILLDRGPDISEILPDPFYTSYDYNAYLLIDRALESGSLKLVKMLLNRGGILSQDRRHNLEMAARSDNSSETLEFLVRELGHRDIDHDLVALRIAANSESRWRFSGYQRLEEVRLRMARFLVSHLIRDLGPENPLRDLPSIYDVFKIAVTSDNLALARILLEHGIDASVIPRTPSLLATACSNQAGPETIKFLIDAGADVSDIDGTSPLLQACNESCDPEVIRLLLEAGSNVGARRTDYNAGWDAQIADNALHESVGSPLTVKMLLDAGVDPRARNCLGDTPLLAHAGKMGGFFFTFNLENRKERIKNFMPCFRMLADASRRLDDINAVNERGQSALHLLASSNMIGREDWHLYVEAAAILIERGARLDIRDDKGMTADRRFQKWPGFSILEELRKANKLTPRIGNV